MTLEITADTSGAPDAPSPSDQVQGVPDVVSDTALGVSTTDTQPSDSVVEGTPDTTDVETGELAPPESEKSDKSEEPEATDWTEPFDLDIDVGALLGTDAGSHNVTLVVDPQHAELLQGVGLDPVAVTKELYSGEFGLGEETLNKLYEAYGKLPIDMALKGLRDSASMAVYESQQAKKSAEEAEAKLWSDTLDLLGGGDVGEKVWGDMEAYASKNFSQDELNEFNSAMASGSRYVQRLAILDLRNKVDSGSLSLMDGGNTSAGKSGAGYMTREEFAGVMVSGEYHKDPQKYDNLRREGLRLGY